MARTSYFNNVSHLEVYPCWLEQQLKNSFEFICKPGETYKPLKRNFWGSKFKEGKPVIAEESLWRDLRYSHPRWDTPKYVTIPELYDLGISVRKSKGQVILESRWCVEIRHLDGDRVFYKYFDSEAAAKNWVSQVFGEFKYKLTV